MKYDNDKISIIGCGRVGMTTAYAILLKGLANELILLGRDKKELIGEELDLEHGLNFLGSCEVKATDDYADIKDSDVVIISAGCGQKPGNTRLDLTENNLKVIEDIIPKVVKHAPNSVIVIISNPVDILTYKAYQIANLPKGRIFGTGTTLDTSRFRFHLGEFLKISPKSIHAYILGEHGDSSFPVLSSAMVGGQSLESLPDFSHAQAKRAYEKVKNAAYKIIESKGSTYYAIATVAANITEAVLRDSKKILPVSIPLHNYLGHSGIALSVPCVIGRNGVEKTLEVKLNWEEKNSLNKSVETLKKYL
jgi:L-lactate dehydrogenase